MHSQKCLIHLHITPYFINYILYCQVTHFVAWMSLDEQRMRAHRDGCLCCVTHKSFQSFEFSRKSILNKVFRMLGLLITNTVFKIFIIVLTITFVVFGVWGAMSLTQGNSLFSLKTVFFLFIYLWLYRVLPRIWSIPGSIFKFYIFINTFNKLE